MRGRFTGDHTVALDQLHYSVAATLGPHPQEGDRLRAWVGEARSTQGRCLYNPVIGFRRDASWDDHGEDYSATWDGPGINIKVMVPDGPQRVGLYFWNDDGHEGMNRCRDYVIRVQGPTTGSQATAVGAPELCRSRVQHFFGGVYKNFVLRGPGEYLFSIERNYSFNTKIAGIMIDYLGGQRQFPDESDQFGLPLMGGTIYAPPVEDTAVDVQSMLATSLWQTASALVTQMRDGGRARPTMIQAYRALPAFTMVNTHAAWRWRLRLWHADDRLGFTSAMSRAWTVYSAINPQLLVNTPEQTQ
jgi:hypothetical protein